ncbi:MAG: MFS transporter [Oscillospiraceae bacterium]|nr:MFS transporter [Oscillospiraceae bacterium]
MQATKDTKRTLAYIGILIVNFMTMFLVASVGTYGYTVAGYFDSISSVGMIFTLESVARCVAIPISGKFSDKVGHRQLFLSALVVYIAAYAVAAFSPSFWVFTIARTVTGFAWGLFVSNIFVLISDMFGQDDAPRYSGIAQSLSTVAMIVGSPVAGILCSLNWRLFFYSSIPVLVTGAVLCFIGIPDVPKQSGAHSGIDVGGCVATFVTLIPFSLAMNWGSTYGWTSPLLLGLIAVAVIGLIGLVLGERKAENPIYPAKLLVNKYYLAIFMVSLFYSLGNAANNYTPTYVQLVLGYSSTVAGFITLPALIIATVLSAVFGNMAANTGRYKKMTVFWALSAVVGGVLFWVMTGSGTSLVGLVLVVLASLFYGMVNGVQQIVPYTYPMKVLKPEELAGGMAFMGVGGALGNTIASGIYGAQLAADPTMVTLFKMPLLWAVIMLIFALIFKDIRAGETL